jgi:hypothetical protein
MLHFSKEMLNNELISHGVFTPAPVIPKNAIHLNRYCDTTANVRGDGFPVTGMVLSLIITVL